MDRIVILGAGGHCKVIIDLLQCLNLYKIEGIVDTFTRKTSNLGIPIITSDYSLEDVYNAQIYNAVIGVGDLELRMSIYKDLKRIGFNLPVLIHNTARVSRYSEIGEGTCVLTNAIINADAKIGKNCIINTAAILEHDCVIGDNTHISPGAKIAGGVKIGSNTHIGIGAVIIQKKTIGNNVTIGAGAVVINDIPDNAVCVGVPAIIIKSK